MRSNKISRLLLNLLDRHQRAFTPAKVVSLACMMLTPMAQAQQEKTLATVEVRDARDPMQVNEGYLGTQTRVGRTLQNPHDVPQALTTVTRQLMDEQQVGSLREALRNVSGLTFNAAEGGRAGDNMMLRGFYTFGDMYLDGIRDTAQYNRETFFLEQVDVLRGSASMLFGRGQAGGVINLVSKTPKRADALSFSASVGGDDYTEFTADLNKQLTGKWAARLNLMKRDEGSWRKNPSTGTEPEIDRGGAHLALGYGVGTDNEVVLSHLWVRNRDIPDYGFSFDTSTRRPNTNFPVKTFWGFAGNFDDSDVNITTLVWNLQLDDASSLRLSLRSADYERSYWARQPSATIAPGTNGLHANGTGGTGVTRAMDYETFTTQLDYTTRFRTGQMRHELIAGLEYLWEDSFRHALRNFGGTTNANPPIVYPFIISNTGTPVKFRGNSYAAFVQDTVEFIPDWKLTLGLRRDELKATYSSATSPRLRYGETSKRAALSWQPADTQHYYLAYSDSFSPTADLYQLTVVPLPPETSKVLELGSKWQLFEGDLALRVALYRATKYWERNTDLESTAAILTKKRRTDGLELEAAGRLTEYWELFAGLALMDAEILEVAQNYQGNPPTLVSANPGYKGQRARNTPPYTFNLWTTYKIGPWQLGGGVEAKGKRYGYNPAGTGPIPTLPGQTTFHPNTAPAYARWDAMLAYERKTWGLRLNVQNVFDKKYFDAIYDNGAFSVPGQARRFILTGELKF
ncbi:MAG: TonB-dependent siderophore receptor [Thiobacillaceae bacterium]|nr:TonB-dependent siderophore receptor [Thiobacillaceae bacterium]